MSRDQFIQELAMILQVDAGALTPEARLGDVAGWDSLAQLSIIALVMDALGIQPDPQALARSVTVRDLVGLFEAHFK